MKLSKAKKIMDVLEIADDVMPGASDEAVFQCACDVYEAANPGEFISFSDIQEAKWIVKSAGEK